MTSSVVNELEMSHHHQGVHGNGSMETLDHNPRLAHHFESMQQQFAAGKLGIWLFLITEILFFSGLFVAYAVYRSTHPEVFVYAHQFLDKSLGALNTVVLIFSSLTIAWAVRAAQLGQRRALVGLLTVTLACASFFLGVKAVEYSHKWDEGMLWGGSYKSQQRASSDDSGISADLPREVQPTPSGRVSLVSQHTPHDHDEHERDGHAGEHAPSAALRNLSLPASVGLVVSLLLGVGGFATGRRRWGIVGFCLAFASAAYFGGVAAGETFPSFVDSWVPRAASEHAFPDHPVREGVGVDHGDVINTTPLEQESAGVSGVGAVAIREAEIAADSVNVEPAGVGIFFSIYYVMTGLHAIHILAGMGVIVWLLVNSVGGMYGPHYFGPVDYVGLYWHLVDLVWIYLFPLLYLIH